MMQLASQQYDEIAAALPLLFEDSGPACPPRNSISFTSGQDQIPEALRPWIFHLLELDEMAELLPAAGVQLSFEELKGLALLRAARQKFLNEHERCGHCGTVKRICSFCPRGCQK